ncbi:hypothetical protein [Methylococcus mesophilus]|uniref:hypothetical protein n=1 Tax=Methylococcus mesophilus TaxID=2993564 RepID=UPI00224ADC96|nr:hypothetical protein [Methylococcus mesophilus]UZR30418.1 hypothetical protein OOT43_07230 [Methylococcus mesophilus]
MKEALIVLLCFVCLATVNFGCAVSRAKESNYIPHSASRNEDFSLCVKNAQPIQQCADEVPAGSTLPIVGIDGKVHGKWTTRGRTCVEWVANKKGINREFIRECMKNRHYTLRQMTPSEALLSGFTFPFAMVGLAFSFMYDPLYFDPYPDFF